MGGRDYGPDGVFSPGSGTTSVVLALVEWGVLRRWVLILENIEWSQGPKRKKGLIRESKGGSFRETSEGEVCSVETGAMDSVLDGGESDEATVGRS